MKKILADGIQNLLEQMEGGNMAKYDDDATMASKHGKMAQEQTKSLKLNRVPRGERAALKQEAISNISKSLTANERVKSTLRGESHSVKNVVAGRKAQLSGIMKHAPYKRRQPKG